MVGPTGLTRAAAAALSYCLAFLGCGGSTAGSGPAPDAGGAPGNESVRACPGVAAIQEPEARCRENDECAVSEWCQAYPPNPCSTATSQCYSDPDCPVGAVCADTRSTSCFGQRISVCQEPCSSSSCPADEHCDADGHCRPLSCSDGFACADDQVCAPERDADEHGCSAARCDEGWTCPTGHVCQPGDEADENGCVAISCTAGFECPVNRRCVADSPYLFTHQCEILTCERDADCDCGYCINSACQDTLGYCALPPIG
jgi:hypothetical protein